MVWLGDEKVVYTDGFDGSKWVCCNGCKKCYHLPCITGDTEQQVEAWGWPFPCTFNQCKKEWKVRISSRSPNLGRSSQVGKWVKKWVTLQTCFSVSKWWLKTNSAQKERRQKAPDPPSKSKTECHIRTNVLNSGKQKKWFKPRPCGRLMINYHQTKGY